MIASGLRDRLRMLVCVAGIHLIAALPVHSQIVISQVFGGGGNSSSPLKNDFIELFNQGTVARPIDGWTVQYASAAGSSWQLATLHGSIQPRQWFLVQLAAGTSDADPLPVPDDTGSFGMSASAGKVALVDTALQLSGSCPASPHIVDFLGWGSASCYLGSGPAPATSNTLAAVRRDSGMAASGDNALDFRIAPPQPRNSTIAPLPVQVLLVTASFLPGRGVTITWTTISELDNYGFVVERKSPADSTFRELSGSFQPGFGTTLETHAYSYTDSTGTAACLYRLRQLDLGGGVHFSDTILVGVAATVPRVVPPRPVALDSFPNPFNPTTVISGQWPVTGVARLSVYDILGREVAVLADGWYPAGRYSFTFDGGGLASGVYVCRLTVGRQSVTRTLCLMK